MKNAKCNESNLSKILCVFLALTIFFGGLHFSVERVSAAPTFGSVSGNTWTYEFAGNFVLNMTPVPGYRPCCAALTTSPGAIMTYEFFESDTTGVLQITFIENYEDEVSVTDAVLIYTGTGTGQFSFDWAGIYFLNFTGHEPIRVDVGIVGIIQIQQPPTAPPPQDPPAVEPDPEPEQPPVQPPLLQLPPPPPIDRPNQVAVPSAHNVLINGTPTAFRVFNIADNNYFMLRDIAFVLNGTGAQFGVDWNETLNAISLTTGAPYVPVGGEMPPADQNSANATPTTAAVIINATPVHLRAYNIAGNNFFMLRDLGIALGFGVDWDDATRTVLVTTD